MSEKKETQQAATTNAGPKIYPAMAKIMQATGAIAKNKQNESQGYKFRGIDDVMNELHSKFAEAGVFILPRVIESNRDERPTKSGSIAVYSTVRVEYKFIASDGSFLTCEVVGEGMDYGDKSTNKAMSAALKYALLQMLLIPTEEDKDSEKDSIELGHGQPPKKPKVSQTFISEEQLNQVRNELQNITTVGGDQKDIDAFHQYMLKTFRVKDFKELPASAVNPVLKAISNFKNKIQSERAAAKKAKEARTERMTLLQNYINAYALSHKGDAKEVALMIAGRNGAESLEELTHEQIDAEINNLKPADQTT